MPKFAILRDLPADLSRADIDGMALEGLVAIEIYNRFCRYHGRRPGDPTEFIEASKEFAPTAETSTVGADDPADGEVRWIRTYWAAGTTWATCLYEAPGVEDLRHFQTTCQVDEGIGVHEVVELADDANTDDAGATADQPAGWSLFACDVPLNGAGTSGNAVADAMVKASRREPLANGAPARWVRAYLATGDPAAGSALALFAARVPVAKACGDHPGLRRIVEVTPNEYR